MNNIGKIKELKEEINNYSTTGLMDDIEQQYYEFLKNISEKYGFETNVYDFDFERIYKVGYRKNDNWDESYLFSVSWEAKEIGKDEDNETLWELTCNVH